MKRSPSAILTAVIQPASIVLALVLLFGGCGWVAKARVEEQRTTQGPTAQQMFNLRVLTQNGREPTFEERRRWDEQIEQQIAMYLREHPEKARPCWARRWRSAATRHTSSSSPANTGR